MTAQIRSQLEHLFPADLLTYVQLRQLEQYPRYLRAAQVRLTRAVVDPKKDFVKSEPFAPLWTAFLEKQSTARNRSEIHRLFYCIEELRVAIYAPELKPAEQVTIPAISMALAALR